MTALKPRDFQQHAKTAVDDSHEKHQRVMICLATGLGKTVIFAHVIKDRIAGGKRDLVLAHREELLSQAAKKIELVTGQKPDIEMAEYWADQPSLVQHAPSSVIVASIPTMVSGGGT